jgi:hypothetical protein
MPFVGRIKVLVEWLMLELVPSFAGEAEEVELRCPLQFEGVPVGWFVLAGTGGSGCDVARRC